MSTLQDFKTFITKGNVIEMAVGIVIGLAFTAVVTALVADLITPLIGVAGHYDFSSLRLTVGKSVFLFGAFLNALISFILIALTVFFAVVRPVAAMEARAKAKRGVPSATTRECPECLSQIPLKAKRCSYCTSPVTPVG
ncbi:MAG TPA: large conductance mechanosensitive channel protein MscL [Thermoplasmata archaeon]|nr:large conductance mechanosensitive channel protein MscL [Thermoplasmata archaeon]